MKIQSSNIATTTVLQNIRRNGVKTQSIILKKAC